MRNSFKVQESNKYLSESWEKANNDTKKHVVNIEESSYKSNLTSGKNSLLETLKPQYEASKPATPSFVPKNKSSSSSPSPSTPTTTSSPSTPSTSSNTSSPSTSTSSQPAIGAFIPRNINKPWGK